MSWGYKITALYVSFVALIITLVFISVHQTVELESKDYYAQELKYQDRIDAINNANALDKNISHKVNGNQVILTAPVEWLTEGFKGEISFLRPSSLALDFSLPMQFNTTTGEQTISGNQFQKGVYKMRLSWQSHKKNYYQEEIINIK